MTKNQVRAIVSTVLVAALMICFFTGVVLFFLKVGMWGVLTRHFLTNLHNVTGFIFGGGSIVHFFLNFRVYLHELRSLGKRPPGQEPEHLDE